jgi:hypothetical protein
VLNSASTTDPDDLSYIKSVKRKVNSRNVFLYVFWRIILFIDVFG